MTQLDLFHDEGPMRHPITGRFMAGDCERDCQVFCAGLCGADLPEPAVIDVETGDFL